MRIGYIYHSSKEKEYRETFECLKKIGESIADITVIDMDTKVPIHEIYWKIRDTRADLWITFECAGFELRTENDTLSLNNIGGRMAHVIGKPLKEYHNLLSEQLNFSMFLYVCDKKDREHIEKEYPNIPNVGEFPSMKEDFSEEQRRRVLSEWFDGMLRELELSIEE